MNWPTLYMCIAWWVAFSGVAFFIGRSRTCGRVLKIRWLGGVRRVLKRNGTQNSTAGVHGVHNPDQSLVLPLWAVNAGLAAVVLTWLLYLVIPWQIRRNVVDAWESDIRLMPSLFRELGLELHEGAASAPEGPGESENPSARTKQSALDEIEGWLETDSPDDEAKAGAARVVEVFTSSKNVALQGVDTRRDLKTFMQQEVRQGNTAPASLAFLISEIAGGTNTNETDALQVYLKMRFLPDDLNPPPSDHLFVGLDRSQDFGVEITQAETLTALHVGLQEEFGKNPARREILEAVFHRLRDRVLEFQRVHVLFVGRIQQATILIFFLAMLLLGGRAQVLALQRGYDALFPDFVKNETDPNLRELLQALDNSEVHLFPRTRPCSVADYKRELLTVEGYTRYVNLHGQSPMPSFMLGALHRFWYTLYQRTEEATSRSKKASSNDSAVAIDDELPEEAARRGLQQMVERAENRLERVEYAGLEYLLWAMPSLGFIGTVVGISESLGNADLVVRAQDAIGQAEAITAVTSVLGVAFDTTLIALVGSIPVMLLTTLLRSKESGFLLDAEQTITTCALEGLDTAGDWFLLEQGSEPDDS